MEAGVERAAAARLGSAGQAGWSRLQESQWPEARALGVPFDVASSLQRQLLTSEVIKTSWKCQNQLPGILSSFRREGVLKASKRFNLPPLKVFGACLRAERDWTHAQMQATLDDPEAHLSGHSLRQFHAARGADGVTKTLAQDQHIHVRSVAFEAAVETRLARFPVSFTTEEAQRASGTTPGTSTPDFLISSDCELVIGGSKVGWIEAKNFFGSALGYQGKKMRAQFEKCHALYGPGAVVFSLGAGESIRQILPPGVIVLDAPSPSISAGCQGVNPACNLLGKGATGMTPVLPPGLGNTNGRGGGGDRVGSGGRSGDKGGTRKTGKAECNGAQGNGGGNGATAGKDSCEKGKGEKRKGSGGDKSHAAKKSKPSLKAIGGGSGGLQLDERAPNGSSGNNGGSAGGGSGVSGRTNGVSNDGGGSSRCAHRSGRGGGPTRGGGSGHGGDSASGRGGSVGGGSGGGCGGRIATVVHSRPHGGIEKNAGKPRGRGRKQSAKKSWKRTGCGSDLHARFKSVRPVGD